MGDETFLESLMEHISTLPHEVKRNLELIKDLDKTCSTLLEELQQRQHQYLQYGDDRILGLEVVEERSAEDGSLTAGLRVPGDATVSAVVPTTEELEDYVLRHDNQQLYQMIAKLQQDALQQAEEKVTIAVQTHALVDGIVQRLDADLVEMESLLQSTGAFYTGTEGAGGGQSPKPNDLAAIQVNPTSAPNDWILAKVITHDPQTGYYKLSDEDIESNKIFHLSESQVVVLSTSLDLKLSRGDVVFAVYPDTTSFYQATVVQPPPRRTSSSALASSASEPYCTVHFVDDSDEHGVTHEKAVLMKHVMLPPYGVVLQ